MSDELKNQWLEVGEGHALRADKAERALEAVRRDLENILTGVDRVKWLCGAYREVAGHEGDNENLLATVILYELNRATDGYIPF